MNEESEAKLDSVSCMIGSHVVDAAATELSRGIYRIRLDLPLEFAFKEHKELRWNASVDGKEFLIVSELSIDEG